MSLSSYNAGAHAGFVANLNKAGNEVVSLGEIVQQDQARLVTSGGLQGQSGDSAQVMGREVANASHSTQEMLNQVNRITSDYGSNMGRTDAKGGANIGFGR